METLCESDVRRYVRAQRHGSRKVRNRTIEADLLALTRALNRATREKDASGKWLLQENPLRGVELPKEKNPRRPVVTEAEFQRLLEVAPQVHPLLRLALVIAEGTGRRLSAWRLLRWEDVDLERETIRWRAENDKKGYEQVVVVTPAVRHDLREARRDRPGIGSAWVFPSPSNESKPCSRYLLDDWLRRAYDLAAARVAELKETDPDMQEVQRGQGSLWHAFRRKWATERKGYALGDVAAAGGWRDTETLLRSYQVTDEATIRNVVLNPTLRLQPGSNSQQDSQRSQEQEKSPAA